MKLSKALEGFLLFKSATISERTVGIYGWGLSKLVVFLDDPEVEAITTDDLLRWLAYLRTDYKPIRPGGDTRPLASESVKNAWRALKSFYTWSESYLSIKRVDAIPCPPGVMPAVVPFTRDEVERLMRAAERVTVQTGRRAYAQRRATCDRNAALISFLIDTGVRSGELGRMTVDDINIEMGAVHVAPHGSGKKARERTVGIGPRTRARLWRYLATRGELRPSDPLFTTVAGKPITHDSLRKLLEHIARRAGVKNCHPHRFRHTFAIEYLRDGGNVFMLQVLLGHASLETTKLYINLAKADIHEAFRAHSLADRWRI